MKRIVVPGEVITKDGKVRIGKHVYKKNGIVYSDCLGIVKEGNNYVDVIPLKGKYIPQQRHKVIGVVVGEDFGGFFIDINSIHWTYIMKKELQNVILNKYDVILATIKYVDEVLDVELEGIKKLFDGALLEVEPVKVPRILGKNLSMLKLLKEYTGSSVIVGMNGRIWIKGGKIELFEKAIRIIEEESHKDKLTERIAKFLEENK